MMIKNLWIPSIGSRMWLINGHGFYMFLPPTLLLFPEYVPLNQVWDLRLFKMIKII